MKEIQEKSFLGMSDILKYLQPVTLRKEDNNNKKKLPFVIILAFYFVLAFSQVTGKQSFDQFFKLGDNIPIL